MAQVQWDGDRQRTGNFPLSPQNGAFTEQFQTVLHEKTKPTDRPLVQGNTGHVVVISIPYSPHPTAPHCTPYTPHFIPYTSTALHLTTDTLQPRPLPHTLYPSPYTLYASPYTLQPIFFTL